MSQDQGVRSQFLLRLTATGGGTAAWPECRTLAREHDYADIRPVCPCWGAEGGGAWGQVSTLRPAGQTRPVS